MREKGGREGGRERETEKENQRMKTNTACKLNMNTLQAKIITVSSTTP